MTALEGIWVRALEEYQEFAASGPGSDDPQDIFCQGYLFGVAFGLALSGVRPDLVKQFEPQFRKEKRGWLKEHEGLKRD